MSKEGALAMIQGEVVTQTPVAPVQGVVNAPESQPSEAVAGTKLDSDRFAKIAAKEAQLQKEREAFKTEQQKMYEEKEKIKGINQQIADFEKLKKTDPVAALKVLGYSDTDIFNALAVEKPAEPTPEEIARKAAQEELKKFEDNQTVQAAKAQEERDGKALAAYRGEIGKFIEKDADKFEYCNHHGPVAQDLIYETVLQFMATDQSLTPFQALKEASEAVESFYEEEDMALMGLKKRQAKLAPKVEEPVAPAAKPSRVPSRPIPTLTNKAAPTAASTAKPSGETREQKRTRLENMLRGGLVKN